jgi:(2Fe-2S) ferredoxin
VSEALVLVGMSVREVDARGRLLALAAGHGATVAFLQQGDPSLSRELTRLADGGADTIVLVGASFGSLAPATSWLRRIAAHWWRERPEPRPTIEVAVALLGEDHELRALAGLSKPITGSEPGLTSAAWEDVTEHRHQVLVCRGPRCTALGSDAGAEALVLACMSHHLGDDDVLITHTGCLFPCNQAPVVVVQPDDVWYGGVTPDVARAIVAEHLVAGARVEANRLRRA